eukprot:CAMPEP_0113631220 /NCGR_PEP_ID=MMETSP0017_2-20120614/16224_1 /TAXON_ID=2856 /ORGANISM="Cylindrotheca closterium" /LENGTH=1165 /DNA_ID=CAMNT_0000541721 /DNA_START=11 /DNA_END=3511 /DNA_ORIENTATION=- /assembly_acc=CAM_ASM_000147
MNAHLLRSKLRSSIEGSSSFFMGSRDNTVAMRDDVSVQSASTGFPDGASTYKSAEEDDKSHRDGSNMVYFVLVLAAIVFGVATFLLLDAGANREFKSEFKSFARETADIAQNNADKIFGQLRSLATAITSIAVNEDNGNFFPNVTVPHFDLRTQEIADLTGLEMISFIPFVEKANRSGWEAYSNANKDWILEDYDYREWNPATIGGLMSDEIYNCDWCIEDSRKGFTDSDGFMEEILDVRGFASENISVPISQYGPAPINSSLSKFDLFSHPIFRKEILTSLEFDVPVISEAFDLSFFKSHVLPNTTFGDDALRSFTLDQVKEDFLEGSRTIGFVFGIIPWEAIFINLLPEDVNGISVVLESSCGAVFTYTANGGRPTTSQLGDRHQAKKEYEEMAVRSKFFWKDHPSGLSRHCHFDIVVYPSDEFRASYESNDALLYSGLVGVVFVFTAMLFFLYDKYVQKRQAKVMSQAKRAEAIVTSVFPKEVGLRLIKQAEREEQERVSNKKMLNNFLVEKNETVEKPNKRRKPIADLFPETTVMFADIVGFTAWSSMREPSQVFMLLESIYRDFDNIANRRKVFKVETVGDCYVAVCGLPEPRKDHVVVMARFATDCVLKMAVQVQALEEELGPDTADLGIRVGLHSGPVTAGVLRGDRARFQLFGDTVNTCARIETTGTKNKIHVSKETAELLKKSGKTHWVTARGDKVTAKGKGELETFWLNNIRGAETKSAISGSSASDDLKLTKIEEHEKPTKSVTPSETIENKSQAQNEKKLDRLVNWNVDVLFTLLKQVDERRHADGIRPDPWDRVSKMEEELSVPAFESGKTALDEVVEIIELPRFNARADASSVAAGLNSEVQNQLREYVRTIATMYNENPFHNFEHASHVTMSVRKLLGRIVAPDIEGDDARDLHDHTYGITSDPLTQFAVVFSALLHDVDHLGVPNTQLVKEGIDIAALYHNKSVAEQNSIDLAWALLMLDRFELLRQAIYTTKSELKRFRQLVVNTILATDIMDKELQTIRRVRWDKAFSEAANFRNDSLKDATNRKATIVIEHLIQASDVAHTMQHWQVYRKWNGRLFHEMYRAFKEGRSQKNPAEFWFQGEIGFFDFYIIPLAKKLDECGVFGVASHEYLNYAEQNRREWEAKGQQVVQELVREADEQNSEVAVRSA